MPTPPQTISLTPASAPGAPSTITLSPASAPSAPETITLVAALGFTISGVTSPVEMNGNVLAAGTIANKPFYTTNGLSSAPAVGDWVKVWNPDFGGLYWGIQLWEDGIPNTKVFTSTQDVATPDLVTVWTAGGTATGTPAFVSVPPPPGTITLSAASAPGAPSTITLSAASGPGAPSTITLSPASSPSAPDTIPLSAASAPAAPSTITLTAASQPAAPGVITPS